MKSCLWCLALLLMSVSLSGCPPRDSVDMSSPLPTLIVVKQLKIGDQTPESYRPATLSINELKGAILGALKTNGVQLDGSQKNPLWVRWQERAQKLGKPVDAFLWSLEFDLYALYGIQTKDGMARVPDKGTIKTMLRGDVGLRPPGQVEAFYIQVDDVMTAQYDPKSGPLKPVYTRQISAMAQALAERVKTGIDVYEKPIAELIKLIGSPSPSMRLSVVQRLAMTRETTAVEAIASQLRIEKNRDVKHRMIGALSEIGDEKAAQALIHLADPRDRETLAAILDALTVVGGQRVDDFFDILSMHDASDVRELVSDARRRWTLRKTKKQKKTSGSSAPSSKEK